MVFNKDTWTFVKVTTLMVFNKYTWTLLDLHPERIPTRYFNKDSWIFAAHTLMVVYWVTSDLNPLGVPEVDFVIHRHRGGTVSGHVILSFQRLNPHVPDPGTYDVDAL